MPLNYLNAILEYHSEIRDNMLSCAATEQPLSSHRAILLTEYVCIVVICNNVGVLFRDMARQVYPIQFHITRLMSGVLNKY